ncbi:hypothetical protein Gotur_010101 [Gossypium turneri]
MLMEVPWKICLDELFIRNHFGFGKATTPPLLLSIRDNSQGWWLGMVNANTNGSSQASVAVEFDTRKSDEQDMEGNHIGGNGNQLWVFIMVPVASVGILVGVAICLCLRRVYKVERFSGSSVSSFSTTSIFAIVPGYFHGHGIVFVISANKGIPGAHPVQHLGLFNETNNRGNTDKLAIRFQEGRAAEGGGLVNGLPKVDREESVQSRTEAKRRKSGSVKRFKQDPASSGPNLTQNATNVHVGYAITDAEMEIVDLGLAADSSSHRSPIDNSLSEPVITKILKPVDFRLPYQPTLEMRQ